MDRDIADFLSTLPISELDAVEISGWAHRSMPWRSHGTRHFPEFDICTTVPLEPVADVLFCEQVLEHVLNPVRAVENIRTLLRPGGFAILSVPFMVRVHNEPTDFWRFTPAGLRILVEQTGLEVVREGDWGNRLSVIANLWFWCPYVPFLQPMWRRPEVPLVVWAVARRPT